MRQCLSRAARLHAAQTPRRTKAAADALSATGRPAEIAAVTRASIHDDCAAAGSSFDGSKPLCNCFAAAKPAAFDEQPVISIVLGDFLSARVDARMLKTVIEEIVGYPAQLVSYDGDYQTTWAALEAGDAHFWPEVWRTEEDEYYIEYVHRRRSVGTAGALGVIGRNGYAFSLLAGLLCRARGP